MHSAVLIPVLIGVATAGFIPQPQPPIIRNPVNCQYSQWTDWTQCSEGCGKQGTQSRTRQILQREQNGGIQCDPSLLEEWRPCFEACKIDCVMGQWSAWSSCQTSNGQSCGLGQRQRTRSILVQPANGGKQCEALEDWQSCNAGPCPRDCEMGQWAPWSQCPQCGQAQRSRSRQVLVQSAFGGRQCEPSLFETEPCRIPECAVDCVMQQWSQWGQCISQQGLTCGFGQRQRTRGILIQPKNGGRQCDTLEDWEACNLGPCAKDCVMGQWSQWTQCQARDGKTCGFGGQRQRTRSILEQAAFGGRQCESLEEWESCSLPTCAQDCVMSQWSQWGQCQTNNQQQCGFGQRARTRTIASPAIAGGRPCGELEEWEQCNAGPCPIDCVMGQWGPFGQCSAQCGPGTKTRTRPVLVQPQFGGRQCLPTVDTIPCNDKPCFSPPDCRGRPTEFYINPAEPCSPNFWKCVNQETHAHVCPNGLMFNIDTFKCAPQFEVAACRRF